MLKSNKKEKAQTSERHKRKNLKDDYAHGKAQVSKKYMPSSYKRALKTITYLIAIFVATLTFLTKYTVVDERPYEAKTEIPYAALLTIIIFDLPWRWLSRPDPPKDAHKNPLDIFSFYALQL